MKVIDPGAGALKVVQYTGQAVLKMRVCEVVESGELEPRDKGHMLERYSFVSVSISTTSSSLELSYNFGSDSLTWVGHADLAGPR